jgi:hypothetical protein
MVSKNPKVQPTRRLPVFIICLNWTKNDTIFGSFSPKNSTVSATFCRSSFTFRKYERTIPTKLFIHEREHAYLLGEIRGKSYDFFSGLACLASRGA